MPSEEIVLFDDFPDRDILQVDICRTLGDDALHMVIGTISKCWLPRLPMKAMRKIIQYFTVREICTLQQVSYFAIYYMYVKLNI